MLDKRKAEIAINATETMNGLRIEGNNFKVSQLLGLRDLLISAMAENEQLTTKNNQLEKDLQDWRDDCQI